MTNFCRKTQFCGLALLALSQGAYADAKADQLLKLVETTMATNHRLLMSVSGTVRDQRPDRIPWISVEGNARLERPNFSRIDYQQSTKDAKGAVVSTGRFVVASDGEALWSYDGQKNEYRKASVLREGEDISSSSSLLSSPIWMFFNSRVSHTDVPPAYVGLEIWKGRPYRVIEFRQDGPDSGGVPLVRQRFYIGPDNLVHRFVNEQLQGKYVADLTIQYNWPETSMRQASFAYTPPPGAKEYRITLPPTLAIGTLAPDLTVEDRNGKPLKLSDLKGKILVLEFWTLNCGHCLESQSHLNAVAKRLAGDVVVLAVNVADTRKALDAWLLKHTGYDAIQFAIAASPADKERAIMLYQVAVFPMAYVIGKDGRIRKAFLGYDGPTQDLELAVKAAG